MPAQADVGGQRAIAQSSDDDTLAHHVANDVVTRFRDFLDTTHRKPLGLEDAVSLPSNQAALT